MLLTIKKHKIYAITNKNSLKTFNVDLLISNNIYVKRKMDELITHETQLLIMVKHSFINF